MDKIFPGLVVTLLSGILGVLGYIATVLVPLPDQVEETKQDIKALERWRDRHMQLHVLEKAGPPDPALFIGADPEDE